MKPRLIIPPVEGKQPPLAGLTLGEIRRWALTTGESPWRGDQIFHWIHARRNPDPAAMTNLPPALRERLAVPGAIGLPTERDRAAAPDGTVKVALGLEDGYVIETVIIPQDEADEGCGPGRSTVCVSTQVGCKVRCSFCRSGREGFKRNLTPAEIAGQVTVAGRIVGEGGGRLHRVVFMGIGEPLDNLEAVSTAIAIISDRKGAALPLGRIVVSTIGRPDGILRLGALFGGRVGLALSVHAVDRVARASLIGPGHADDLGAVLEAARAYPMPRRERLTVEVVLVSGINDSKAAAAALARALHGIRARVNLIPLNPFEGVEMSPPDDDAVGVFRETLVAKGIDAFLRRRKGARILASCGQLAFGRYD